MQKSLFIPEQKACSRTTGLLRCKFLQCEPYKFSVSSLLFKAQDRLFSVIFSHKPMVVKSIMSTLCWKSSFPLWKKAWRGESIKKWTAISAFDRAGRILNYFSVLRNSKSRSKRRLKIQKRSTTVQQGTYFQLFLDKLAFCTYTNNKHEIELPLGLCLTKDDYVIALHQLLKKGVQHTRTLFRSVGVFNILIPWNVAIFIFQRKPRMGLWIF